MEFWIVSIRLVVCRYERYCFRAIWWMRANGLGVRVLGIVFLTILFERVCFFFFVM